MKQPITFKKWKHVQPGLGTTKWYDLLRDLKLKKFLRKYWIIYQKSKHVKVTCFNLKSWSLEQTTCVVLRSNTYKSICTQDRSSISIGSVAGVIHSGDTSRNIIDSPPDLWLLQYPSLGWKGSATILSVGSASSRPQSAYSIWTLPLYEAKLT